MQPQKVWAVYFSGTGTTEKTVRRIASSLAAAFSAPLEAVDFTAPAVRKEALTFGPDDLVVLGTPTPMQAVCPSSSCPISRNRSAAPLHRRYPWSCSATAISMIH